MRLGWLRFLRVCLLSSVSVQVIASPEPVTQIQFCNLTQDYRAQLHEARQSRNEIRINLVEKARQQNLDALLPNGEFENWVVRFDSLRQVQNGASAIWLMMDCGVRLGSGEISLDGEETWAAVIDHGSRQYREAAKLGAGDQVLVSGKLFAVERFVDGQLETFYAVNGFGENEQFIIDMRYMAKVHTN